MAKKTISVCDAKGCGKELETPIPVKVGTKKKEVCPDCEKKLLLFLGEDPVTQTDPGARQPENETNPAK